MRITAKSAQINGTKSYIDDKPATVVTLGPVVVKLRNVLLIGARGCFELQLRLLSLRGLISNSGRYHRLSINGTFE